MISGEALKVLANRIRRIPIFETLEMRLNRMEDGYAEVSIPRRRRYDGIYESLHGGILMTLADSVAAFVILTLTGPDERITTTDMSIRFLAPCYTGVTAKARVIKLGRSMCPVAVDLYDADDIYVAVAQVNYMRFSKKNKY